MHTIALFGAGKIGESITTLLAASGRYTVKVCDIDGARAAAVAAPWKCCEAHQLDTSDDPGMRKILDGCELVINALPFFCNKQVVQAAADKGVHYIDLTEDVETTRFITALALSSSSSCFIPQCGLAPGFVSIAAAHLIKFFDSVDTVKMRVGALPIYPTNRLKYNLTWSTDGLINEYCNLCDCIEDGRRLSVLPLEGYERFTLNGDEYEAFNTSGGVGTMCDSLQGRVRELNYKTIRYPGHRDLIAFLLHDLRFTDDRASLKTIFERSISSSIQDKCLILVEVTGMSKGRFTHRTYVSTVYNQEIAGKHLGAIQLTTAAGACTAIDLLLSGKLQKKFGLIRAEDISLDEFLKNDFGRYYRDEHALSALRA